ncbi:MAG: VCBS repeat-containing protein, partial [Acidobacteriota bacterium]|nr:VCBS repeat-containing protein [Acidobacteriota bacterium]
MLSRRNLLAVLGASPLFAQYASPLLAQGVATRGVKPQPRGKPSGIPFNANFVDVAQSAGLRAPVIYGGIDRKDYILETIGCGCAFLDYDNDGWLDALVLCGTRVAGAPEGATDRLYKNNRDGTFTDVTEKAGVAGAGYGMGVAVGDYDNDGRPDL